MAKTNAPTIREAQEIASRLRMMNDTCADAWVLNLNLSLRISDLLSLTYDDVCGNTITIKEGKTGKSRSIPVNQGAREIINNRRKKNPGDIYIFQSKSNRVKNLAPRPVRREVISQAFKEASRGVTDKNINTHSARKCRGRVLWESGVPVETICRMLNHSSPAITMTYLDITQEEVNKTYSDFEFKETRKTKRGKK